MPGCARGDGRAKIETRARVTKLLTDASGAGVGVEYPAKPGAPVQKGRPSIKSAWVAWLQGSYNPNKGGKPLGMLVALPKA